MGLDSYLYRETYLADRPWATDGDPAKTEGSIVLDAIALVPGISLVIPPESLGQTGGATVQIDIKVGYWRKANAVHGWFVNRIADGVDECQRIWADRDKLAELRDDCAAVLVAKGTPDEAEVVEEHLPPTGGFFFGNDEADDWYWDQARRTHDLLSWLLKHDAPDASYYYQASW